MEEEVVNNRMKVEKAQYANKNNAFRINQAETKIKQIPLINEQTEKENSKKCIENSLKKVKKAVFIKTAVFDGYPRFGSGSA